MYTSHNKTSNYICNSNSQHSMFWVIRMLIVIRRLKVILLPTHYTTPPPQSKLSCCVRFSCPIKFAVPVLCPRMSTSTLEVIWMVVIVTGKVSEVVLLLVLALLILLFILPLRLPTIPSSPTLPHSPHVILMGLPWQPLPTCELNLRLPNVPTTVISNTSALSTMTRRCSLWVPSVYCCGRLK